MTCTNLHYQQGMRVRFPPQWSLKFSIVRHFDFVNLIDTHFFKTFYIHIILPLPSPPRQPIYLRAQMLSHVQLLATPWSIV